jgi:hypothetical protein
MHSSVRRLRTFGSGQVMLRECYGRANRLWIELFDGNQPNSELARSVYYRVTGKPFNSVPPPLSKHQAAGRTVFDEFEWDPGLGGDTVAGQVRGLSLLQSRMDGLCKADEGWAYVEWILEFKNDHERSQREARAQVLLPPGGGLAPHLGSMAKNAKPLLPGAPKSVKPIRKSRSCSNAIRC